MKLALLILGAVLATTLAAHNGMPNIQNMPNINMLNMLKDGKMPEIPAGMKISDLKDAFYNLPPSMKEKLNDMAQSFGMQLDDVEDALNNPPEKLKEFFDKNGDGPAQPKGNPMGNIGDLLQNVDMGQMAGMLKGVDVNAMMKNIDPATISGLMQNMDMGPMGDIMKNMDIGAMMKDVDLNSIMKNMDMGAMGDIMKNVDVGGMMKNMDMGAMGDIMKNVDVGGMMKNMDMGAMGDIMKNVDVGGMMKNMDLGAMGDVMKNVDVGGMMKNMDMGAMGDIMKNVDVAGLMKNMDMGAMGDIMKNMDMGAIGGLMKNMDMGAISGIMKNMDIGAMSNMMKNVDIAGIMKNMDMGSMGDMMKNMDIGAITGMMKNVDLGSIMKMTKDLPAMMAQKIPEIMAGKLPSFEAVKSVFGIPEDASIEDIRSMVNERLNAAGVPLDSPVKLLEFIQEKIKGLPLPAGMDPTDMLNMVHEQMETMGIPEDPSKLQEFVFEKIGLSDIKDIEELRNPEVLAKLMQKKALGALGIDENADPNEVKDKIKKQLIEEAKKLGASLPDDFTKEAVMEEMNKLLTKELNGVLGTEAKSIEPMEIHNAVKDKLMGMGIPVNNFGSLKKHLIDMAMKHVMNKAIPMVMNFFMPRPRQQMPRQMPPQMPPQMFQMPPQMRPQMPPVVPLNLDIEVNVEQPSMMQMPRYLQGVEHAVNHQAMESYDDASVYHHIMAVRQALRYGEMPEEALQELVEDLMNARLKTRVLSVRNMFLSDRMAAMEREMEMMSDDVPEMVPRRSFPQDPIRRMLRPRVF